MRPSKAKHIVYNKGIFQDENTALAHVLQKLVDAFDPYAVWLFGSRALGKSRSDSDFDLLLVSKPLDNFGFANFGSADYEKVIEPLRGLGVGCDVIPCSYVDFEEASSIKTSLIAQVITNGKKLYDEKTH